MNFDSWKELFKNNLGNRSVQYHIEVVPILLAVDEGVKPSFLWDVCTPDTNGLLSLMRDAFSKGLLISKLTVLEIDLDVFIVNLPSLSRCLNNFLNSLPNWLIDLSSSEPKIASKETHANFKINLISVLDQIESKSKPGGSSNPNQSAANVTDKAILIQLPENTNLSTIFGCFLGYPHIYYWQGETGEKSLGGTPLKIFKLSATCKLDNNPIELFSYSIPETLEKDLRPGIEIWGNEVNVWVEQARSFSDTKFKCDSMLCLSVAL